jgi:peptidoglycan biosynthesis protein MviN/MurJ (putative lipid II flippase)
MVGLVIANSAMLTGHALIMLWLTQTRLGGFGRQGVIAMTGKVSGAAVAMGAVAFFVARAFDSILLQVFASTLAAGVVYIALLRLLRVREAARVWELVLARARR